MSADVDDVLDAIIDRLTAAGLTLAAAPVPVRKGKRPHQEEGESYPTQYTVCPAQPPKEPVRRFSNRHDLHVYRAQVVFWTPGNQTRTENLPELAALEDAAQQLFDRRPADLLGLDGVRDVRASAGVFLDQGAYLQGWDVIATDVSVEIVRAAP